jgi:hypothetical protein
VLAPGYFGHVDAAHAQIHARLLPSAIQELRDEMGEKKSAPAGFFCLTIARSAPNEAPPDIPDLLRRIDALLTTGGNVLLFRQRELYHMTGLVNRYTTAPVRFVVGLSLIIRAFEDPYGNLEGNRLEALARLLAQNVRIYAYPMTAADLRESLHSTSASGWEWSEENGWVSVAQLRRAGPLGHLFNYLLTSNFIVPIQAPAALRADA